MEIFERAGPLGTALGVAAVALAVSPTVRQRARRAVVSATASVMSMANEIRSMASEASDRAHSRYYDDESTTLQ